MNRARIKKLLDRLADRDPELRRALDRLGYPPPRQRPAGFETLLSTIVSQQISTAAAASIMNRLRASLPDLSPAAVLELDPGALRAAGLSARKAGYVDGLARTLLAGDFDPAALGALDDEAAIAAIVALRGFGRWSAEIYLMFSLGREDVFPAGDLALRVALQRFRGLDEPLDERRARALMAGWAPYRSAASLFLWHYYRGAPT